VKCPEQVAYRISRVSPPIQCRTCGRHAVPYRLSVPNGVQRGALVRVLILEHYPYAAARRKGGGRG